VSSDWLASRSVDRCSMTRDASAPTAAGGCLTDRTIMPALSMPHNGGRVDSASRTFSPDEGRDAYAKWHLRSSASSDGIRKVMTRKGRFRDRDWTRGNILCHAGLKARFNHVPIVFTGMAATHNEVTKIPSLEEQYIASAARRSKPSSTLDRRTPQSK
jgi:hypothetical protein